MPSTESKAPTGVQIIEWSGSVMGLLGSYLVAANISATAYGFAAFLLSNLLFIVYGVKQKAWGIVTMQIGFTGSSIMGIIRWAS